jgi:hypothetical protein
VETANASKKVNKGEGHDCSLRLTYVIQRKARPTVDDLIKKLVQLGQDLAMKIICPVCELNLVEISMESGLATFWCERCCNLPENNSN